MTLQKTQVGSVTTRRQSTARRAAATGLLLAACLGLTGCVGGGADGRGAQATTPTGAVTATTPAGGEGDAGSPPELRPATGGCAAAPAFRCATLRVPLDRADRADGAGGRITLRVAVQAGRRPPRGYLVVLTGGPGQPGLPYARRTLERLRTAARGYGLVLLDQRGTGRGALQCPQLQRAVGSSDVAVAGRGSVEACARRLGARRAAFATADTVADLEDLRRALGAERLTLAGISYGSFVAERFALSYPQRVRALVLDSVVRQQGADALQVANMAAVPRVLRAVCRAEGCRTDPAADLRAALAFGFDGVELLDTVTALSLGEPRLDEVPAALHEAAHGRLGALERLGARAREEETDVPATAFSSGLHAATLCTDSDVPWKDATVVPADREQALAQARAKLTPGRLGGFEASTAVENGIADTCRRWAPLQEAPTAPTGLLPAVPTLLLAGELDLSTPLEDAQRELERAPKGKLVVIPRMGHSVLLADPSGCAVRVAGRFLAGRPVGECAG